MEEIKQLYLISEFIRAHKGTRHENEVVKYAQGIITKI